MTNQNQNQQFAVNQNRAALACIACLNAGITPYIISPPGCGKTTLARAIGKQLNFDGVLVITPTTHDTFKIQGLPFVRDNQTHSAPCADMPTTGKWLIILDEFADVPLHEQSTFYQLALEGRVGSYKLPDGSKVIICSNDVTHGAAANEISSAFKTRVMTVYMQNEIDQSIKYALRNNWHSLVVGFIRSRPDCLSGFDQNDFAGGCTPRNLEQISQLEKSGFPADDSTTLALCQGLLGRDFGTSYDAFRKLQLPDVNQVFKNPQTADICDSQDKQFAFAAAIVSACDDSNKFKSVCDYANRLERVEAIGLISDCVRKSRDFKTSAFYAQAVAKYGDLFI